MTIAEICRQTALNYLFELPDELTKEHATRVISARLKASGHEFEEVIVSFPGPERNEDAKFVVDVVTAKQTHHFEHDPNDPVILAFFARFGLNEE